MQGLLGSSLTANAFNSFPFYLFIYFWLSCAEAARGTSAPWPGMEPGPPASGVWGLNPWTPRKSLPSTLDTDTQCRQNTSLNYKSVTTKTRLLTKNQKSLYRVPVLPKTWIITYENRHSNLPPAHGDRAPPHLREVWAHRPPESDSNRWGWRDLSVSTKNGRWGAGGDVMNQQARSKR